MQVMAREVEQTQVGLQEPVFPLLETSAMKTNFDSRTCVFAGLIPLAAAPVLAQLVDRNTATNALNEGIAKTYTEEIGAGRGDINTPNSSLYIINRDPFRAAAANLNPANRSAA